MKLLPVVHDDGLRGHPAGTLMCIKPACRVFASNRHTVDLKVAVKCGDFHGECD